MKTRELIEQLSKCDPDGKVFLTVPGEYGPDTTWNAGWVLESKANGNAFIYGDDEKGEDK